MTLEGIRVKDLAPLKVLGRRGELGIISLVSREKCFPREPQPSVVVIWYNNFGLIKLSQGNEVWKEARPASDEERAIILAAILAG